MSSRRRRFRRRRRRRKLNKLVRLTARPKNHAKNSSKMPYPPLLRTRTPDGQIIKITLGDKKNQSAWMQLWSPTLEHMVLSQSLDDIGRGRGECMQSARTTAPTASAPDERMGHSVCNGDDPEICLFLPRGFAHVFARTALRANCSQESVGHSS